MELFEDGLVDAWRSNYSANNDFCEVPEANSVVKVGMQPLSIFTVGGVFVLLAIGYGVAVAGFVFERWLDGVVSKWLGVRKKSTVTARVYAPPKQMSLEMMVAEGRGVWIQNDMVSVRDDDV